MSDAMEEGGAFALAAFTQLDLIWALGSLCALHQKPFAADLIAREYPGPAPESTLIRAARALGFRIKGVRVDASNIAGLPMPLLVAVQPKSPQELQEAKGPPALHLALIAAVGQDQATLYYAGTNAPTLVQLEQLQELLIGPAWLIVPEVDAAEDADAGAADPGSNRFGFGWFVPELLRHRKAMAWVNRGVASATSCSASEASRTSRQTVDKVVVHRTQSTLVAIGVVMAILLVFNAVLSWGRQYLVLHTGNRVDAVLGAAVWDHLSPALRSAWCWTCPFWSSAWP